MRSKLLDGLTTAAFIRYDTVRWPRIQAHRLIARSDFDREMCLERHGRSG
jgi:hypothetical protein